MSLLGIDLGSGSCKGVAFGVDGAILARAERSYSTYTDAPGSVLMDPENMWNAAVEVIREVNEQVQNDPVEALAVSSHGETFIPMGKDMTCCGPAIMNSDNRAVKEAAWWEETLGSDALYKITGLPLHAMFSLNKIMWMRENEPDIFHKSVKFISAGDYILAKMGFGAVTDYSLASRTMAFDINTRSWSEEILSRAGLTKEQFPELVQSGYRVGVISEEIARITGLKQGIGVATGGHDQPCGALGAGVIKAGDVSDSAGTYECMVVSSDKPMNTEKARKYSLNSYCHVVPDQYVTLAFFPAGVVTRWFTDHLCGEERLLAKEQGVSMYSLLEKNVLEKCPAPTGICLTPHFVGACNPFWDVRAKGAVYGLTPESSKYHIYKAIFEGIACELAINVEVLSEIAGDFNDIRIMGGNSRLDFTVQMRADIANKRFVTLDSPEAVCHGAAMLAGISAGIYADAADAVKRVNRQKVFTPNEQGNAAYQRQFNAYKALYPSLTGVREVY